MSLCLLAFNPFPLNEVAQALRREGVDVTPVSLNQGTAKPLKGNSPAPSCWYVRRAWWMWANARIKSASC